MPRPPSSAPTEVELAILRVLWERGEATAREVHDALSGERTTTYSTTVKMLSVMLEKELVRRDDSRRPQRYRASEARAKTQKSMLSGLVSRLYDGSTKSLVMQALSMNKASPAELDEIRELLKRLEDEA